MKFARYLEDTQTPEWKRAYIDYRKLKRCVREISGVQLERSRSGPSSRTSVRSGPTAPGVGPDGVVVSSARTPRGSPLTFRGANPLPPASEHSFTPSRAGREADRLSDNRLPFPTYGSHGHSPPLTRMSSAREPEPTSPVTELPPALQDPADGRVPTSSGQDWQTDPRNTSRRRLSLSAQISTYFRVSPANARHRASTTTGTSVQRTYSLNEIYHTLPPPELRFFDILDKELDKVEKFYLEKLEELVIFSSLLNEQLRELEAHRKVYHEVQDNSAAASRHWGLVGDALHIITTSQGRTRAEGPSDEFSSTQEQISGAPPPRDPDLYHQNKKKLKKATREHYRGIELLNDYRILNLTGFRKALKKFQKVTRIPAQQPYMTEKVDNCAFASEPKMLEMISNIESLYALHFTDGDKKVARERLRDTMQGNPQHTRSFRSGLYTGLGIAALSRVIFLSFQEETREAIPAWAALLQVYGGFLLPVVLALLIGANMLVWKRHRINYGFIFELDVRTMIDPRQYVEIPSFAFLTLSYCALLSFSRVGNIAATTWPLVWLGFTICFVLNPLPMFARSSRHWFLKKFLTLFVSGLVPVEFSDFWLGDQFCSLTFSLASLWTLACSVHNDWAPDSYEKCGLAHHWQTPFVLSCMPSLIRFVQCLKRYSDSGLRMHMINGGKYLSSVMYYVFYYLWRHNGAKIGDTAFILLCLSGSVMSLYTSAWDLLVDWSLLDPMAEYRFLRTELLYRDYIPRYYFAIVSNVLIRFIWFSYFLVPSGLNITPRTFIAAFLEILRRAHWNIYRLENEQLGNMDQYRATREIPLPYTFQDEGEDDNRASTGLKKAFSGRLRDFNLPSVRLPQMNTGHIREVP